MESNKRISELLVETGAYKDLDKPVILTSGELGIYFINTEKLMQDGGKFNEYGEAPQAMIKHAVQMMKEHPTFEEVIDILAEQVNSLFPEDAGVKVISGGQRRDWIFSGPIAHKLGMPHISLYKDGKLEYTSKAVDGVLVETNAPLSVYSVHIADLMTLGSSAYDPRNDPPTGWIPMLRNKGIIIKDYLTVVTRLQGGEEIIKQSGVDCHAQVAIDINFLNDFSKDPTTARAYQQDPTAWSRYYLKENGATALVSAFNPEGDKLPRAQKFINMYGKHLTEVGKFDELNNAVKEAYGKEIDEILGGE